MENPRKRTSKIMPLPQTGNGGREHLHIWNVSCESVRWCFPSIGEWSAVQRLHWCLNVHSTQPVLQ